MKQQNAVNPRPAFVISQVTRDLYNDWLCLFAGYRDFYGADVSKASLDLVWSWVSSDQPLIHALIAYFDGRPAGLLQYHEAPDPVAGKLFGFLNDLYVADEYRGMRIGDQLIDHLIEIGNRRDWLLIGFQTDDNNYRARRLYDRVAKKTLWNTYEIDLPKVI